MFFIAMLLRYVTCFEVRERIELSDIDEIIENSANIILIADAC